MVDPAAENADDGTVIEEETPSEEFHDAATVMAGTGMNLHGDVKTEIHISVEIKHAEARGRPKQHHGNT
jgi:hypothetical protein